jgi:hypothetical protein
MKAAKDVVKNGIRSRLDYIEKQVQNSFQAREPRAAAAAGKPAARIPTTNDIKKAGSIARAGVLQPQQTFTLDVPVVENSAGVKRSLKKMVYDPSNKNLRIVVDVPDAKNPNKVSQVEYASFTRKKKVKGKLDKGDTVQNIPPDLAELNRFAVEIYDENNQRYLYDYEELIKYLDQKSSKANIPAKEEEVKGKSGKNIVVPK